MNKMHDAFNWGRNWATLQKRSNTKSFTVEHITNSMLRSFGFEKWQAKYRDEFWRGFHDGGAFPDGETVAIDSQQYNFYPDPE